MKGTQIIILVICLVVIVVLGGCKKQYVQDGEHELVMRNNALAESEDINELLNRAQKVKNISYDLKTITPANKESKSRFWLKGDLMRFETEADGKKTVTIYDGENNVSYIWDLAANSATKMSMGFGREQVKSITEETAALDKNKIQVTGSEVLDEKNCLVVEYKWGSLTTKAWLWKKYGLPIKIESDDTKEKQTITYENFNFGVIPDKMFQVPDDVALTDLTRMNLSKFNDIKLPLAE